MKIHPSLLGALAIAAPAAAQSVPMAQQIDPQDAQGLFTNLAVGMSVVDVNENASWWIRAPGVNGGVPIEWNATTFGAAAAGRPDYSLAALSQHWSPSGLPPSFGGISTGGEIMPAVDSLGQMMMGPEMWYMLSIAVDRYAKGQPGSLLESRGQNGRNPAGDILSYYADGSTGIHENFPHTVRLEYSREQLSLQAGVPATSVPREIHNHDFGMGVISADPRGRAGGMFPVRDCFYFTLTQDWVTSVLQLNPSYVIDGFTPNASTVYVMTWPQVAPFAWSAPRIAFDHDTLFPNVTVGTVEIDALSVDRGAQTPTQAERVVLSLTPASDLMSGVTRNQILVYQRLPILCLTQPLRSDASEAHPGLVSDHFGLLARGAPGTGEPDNVGSTCGGDPREPFRIGPVMGLATSQNRAGAGELGLTMVRQTSSTEGDPDTEIPDVLHIQVTGLAHAPHQLGFVQLYLEDVVSSNPANPVPLGSAYWIDPTSYARNALDIPVQIPAQTTGAHLRISAYLIGVNIDPSLTIVPLRESWVVTIEV